MHDFTGRHAVVVGGSSGLGRAVAQDLIARGARVAVLGRDQAALNATLSEQTGHLALTADVLNGDDLAAAFARVRDTFGSLDIGVNSLGTFPPPTPAGDLESDVLAATLATNVTGLHAAMRHEIALMRERQGGAIVNFSSNIGARATRPGFAAYGTSKAAVSALSRAAALDHIAEGIRINAICPGPSDTAMSYRKGETRADRDARVAQQNPSGRVAHVEEIVSAVRYLLSDDAAYVVGTELVVDGGATS